MTTAARAESAYRLSVAHVLRVVAPIAVLIGAGWLVLALTGLPRGWTVALALATIAAAVAGVVAIWRPPRVLTLTEDGYRVGLARSVRRARTPWREVESVATAEVRGSAAMVFALSDGRRAVLPLSLLGGRAAEAQRDVHERLNSAYGYRRL